MRLLTAKSPLADTTVMMDSPWRSLNSTVSCISEAQLSLPEITMPHCTWPSYYKLTRMAVFLCSAHALVTHDHILSDSCTVHMLNPRSRPYDVDSGQSGITNGAPVCTWNHHGEFSSFNEVPLPYMRLSCVHRCAHRQR